MSGPDAERVPWYAPGGADLVFLLAAVVIVQGARQTMLDDPGLGWHLRNIDAILDKGWWLTEDPFTIPHAGKPRPWYTNQWLGDLALWLGWKWAGEEGIAVVTAVVLAFILRCVFRFLMRDGLPWPAAVFWTTLAGLGTGVSWVARPNMFTLLFLLLTGRVCNLFHEGRLSRAATWSLVPLFVVWANTHGGFLAGLITLGVTLGIEAVLAVFTWTADGRGASRGRAVHLAILLPVCFASTLVNPYGWRLYPWILQLLREPFFMDFNREWWSPNFHETGSFRFELLMLLYPAILGLSRRRPTVVEVGLGVVWLYFALNGMRYVPLWVLLAVPTMARSSVELPWLAEAVERIKLSEADAHLIRAQTGRAGWLWTATAALALIGASRLLEGRFARHDPRYIPTAALDRLLDLHRQRPEARIYHTPDWGGYLTWKGWPGFLNWIDDRNEVPGVEGMKEWQAIFEARPGWQAKLDRERIEIVAVQGDAALSESLTALIDSGTQDGSEAAWREAYRQVGVSKDGKEHVYAVIFERTLR